MGGGEEALQHVHRRLCLLHQRTPHHTDVEVPTPTAACVVDLDPLLSAHGGREREPAEVVQLLGSRDKHMAGLWFARDRWWRSCRVMSRWGGCFS